MIQLPDELNLIVSLALLALIPFIAMMATSFVKLRGRVFAAAKCAWRTTDSAEYGAVWLGDHFVDFHHGTGWL